MNISAGCGHDNRPGARSCDSCGAELALAVDEHRKVDTVLFCALVGSAALGETTDPEGLLLARSFERMGRPCCAR